MRKVIVKMLKKWYYINNSIYRDVRKWGMTVKKLDDIISRLQENELISRELLKRKEEEEKEDKLIWIFAIIGVVVLAVAVAYAVYRCLTPKYLDDFEDAFDDDDYEDDFFDDEDDESVAKESEK